MRIMSLNAHRGLWGHMAGATTGDSIITLHSERRLHCYGRQSCLVGRPSCQKATQAKGRDVIWLEVPDMILY